MKAPKEQFDKSRFCVLYKRVRDGVVVATQNASEFISSRIQQRKDELSRGRKAPRLVIENVECTNMEPLVAPKVFDNQESIGQPGRYHPLKEAGQPGEPLVAKPMDFEGQGEVADKVDDGKPLVAKPMSFEK